MITYFYKILYNNKDVVYVGVTTKTVHYRFKQHIKAKNLDNHYSVIEIDRIVHPKLDSLEVFYQEKYKVTILERKYIQEERDKGSNLLNISDGGEWGATILNRLLKDNFLKNYGSYDGYEQYKKRIDKSKGWIRSWIHNKTENRTKKWITSWKSNRTKNKASSWLRGWIYNKTKNKTSSWISIWLKHASENKTHVWLKSWKFVKIRNKTRVWLRHWIEHRSETRFEVWMFHWIEHRSETRFKVWMFNWVARRKNDQIIK